MCSELFLAPQFCESFRIGVKSVNVYRIHLLRHLLLDFCLLEVLKITGSDVDEDRTWDITKYIPETENYLNAYDILLKSIVDELSVYSDKGPNSASIAYVQRAIKLLKESHKS